MIGPWEIFLILLVVLVVFGAGRLPTIMGDLAKGVRSFKEGLKDEDAARKDTAAEDPKRLTHKDARADDKVQSTDHRSV